MSTPLCLCGRIGELRPRLTLRTRVLLLAHWSELKTSTNTARIASQALPNSQLIDRGRKDRASADPAELLRVARGEGYAPVLLFPTEDSEELTRGGVETACGGRPPLLIVPDGNWRQASKIPRREPAFQGVPRFRLPPGPPSEFVLRREPQKEFVCTLEAVARALGILEGAQVQEALEELLRTMVSRVLWVQGKVSDADVFGGLPEGAGVFRAIGPLEWLRRNRPEE